MSAERVVFIDDSCALCGHAPHDGPCAGDPLDVPDSGPGGVEPHVPTGCSCGGAEFDGLPGYGCFQADWNGNPDDEDEGLLRDDD